MLIRPKEGILDPQGQAVERALPALGFEGASEVRVGRLVELEVEDASRLDEMCERLLANPLIEDYEVWSSEVRGCSLPRVVRRDRRRCWPASATATPSCCGTATATCGGVDAVVIPGGFSYGDYLRVGAIARFSPVMEAVADHARSGGIVFGICNGFQVLCEAGLLPGCPPAQRRPAVRLPPGGCRSGQRRQPLHARV